MTHMTISAIVYAKTEEEGFEQAKVIFDQLIEFTVFDYYNTFEDEKFHIFRADSEGGKKWIKDAMKATRSDFERRMKTVRVVLANFSNDDIFEGKCQDEAKLIALKLKNYKELLIDLYDARYYMYKIGEGRGSSVWLYDQDGEGIMNNTHLENVLKRWNDDKLKDMTIYIVPADAHY